MKYVLINRGNVVVDILNEVRYIKLQSNGYVVACPESEGTGVIGSDCDTHYALIKTDTLSSPNAVRVIEREEIPSELTPGLYKLDTETNEFVYRYSLEEAQEMKQEQNKVLFAEYLAAHPLTWVDGKEYGVTMEDQSEISLNINQYQIALQAGVENPVLEWHARHEECTAWPLEQLVALSLAISEVVYPMYRLCQEYKIAIYGATSMEELAAVQLVYGEEPSDEEAAE